MSDSVSRGDDSAYSGVQVRHFLDSVQDHAFITFDLHNRITSWSAGATRITGWEEAEILGQSGAILFTPEDRAQGEVEKEFSTTRREGRAEDERWHLKKDGERFWASGVMSAVLDEAGNLVALAKVMRDLTERKRADEERARAEAALRESEERYRTLLAGRIQAEHALAESEARLRTILEGIPQLVWQSQDRGQWTWASPQWLAFTGQTLQESEKDGWLNALHPEDRGPAMQAWLDAARRGSLDVEYRIRRASDRAHIWHRTRAVPLRNTTGQIVEWLGTSTDIEGLKGVEAALIESEQRFRLFVQNVQEYALVQTDPDRNVTSWNPGAERLFGYSSAEMLGQPVDALLTAEDREGRLFVAEYARVFAGETVTDARWLVRKDGTRFWVQWVSEAIRDEAGRLRGVAKVLRDETERRQAENAIRASLAEKEELLAEVHHRVKNNLQVIISLINLQAANVEDTRVLALFDEARNRVYSIATIHESIYRSATFAGLNLANYARQLVPDLVRFYGAQERIEVSVDGDGVMLELERAVPYGLLLNELVSNVCKHAFPNGRRGELRVRVNQEDDHISLEVADTGVGLPPGFDNRRSGSLGLQLVHSLARQLRATVEFVPGHGTRVAARIPRRKSTEDC